MKHAPRPTGSDVCDLCVITARDIRQATLFQSQMRALSRRGALAPDFRWLVVTDPPGPPLGTAGATLYAICAALDELRAGISPGSWPSPEDARIFVIHCGGQSQRLPQFAQLGKVFAPLPGDDGLPSPLLLEVIHSLATVSQRAAGGVFIACGDALFQCAPEEVRDQDADAVVYVCAASPAQAARHGVYAWDRLSREAVRVEQKPCPEQQQAFGLVDDAGQAWLDTGLLALSPRLTRAWLSTLGDPGSARSLRNRFRQVRACWEGVELYKDVTGALIPGNRAAPERLRQAFAGFRLRVAAPESGRFLHFGTTSELIDLLCGAYALKPGSRTASSAWVHPEVALGAQTLIQASVLESPNSSVGARSVVHFASTTGRLELAGSNHVLGVHGATDVRLPADTLLYQAPVQVGGIAADALVTLGTHDNPKQRYGDEDVCFLGDSLERWLRERSLAEEALWHDGQRQSRSLWNARLFPVGRPGDVHTAARWLRHGSAADGEARDAWNALPRISMAEVSQRFDASRWRRYERALLVRLLTLRIAEVRDDAELLFQLTDQARHLGLLPQTLSSLRRLARKAAGSLEAARLWQYSAVLSRTLDLAAEASRSIAPERDQNRAFEAVGAAVRSQGGRTPLRGEAVLVPGDRVLAEAPVRVDLAGGWSDTPPQALERGGRVLNVALELHGIRPIRTEVEIIPELRIELCCRETGLRTVIEEMDRLRAYTDPSDPFCLHKAALFEAGFFTERDRGIASRLRGLGGGVRIFTESRVPKGSGLGTSSILGATLVAALGEIYGRSFAPADCSNRVLRLEQRLTTGGGWQDQVGALTPGFKIASTAPGLDQTPEVAEVNVPHNVIRELEARLVVFYTGVPRLARNVLQRVVSRYLLGEREVVEGLEEMPGLVSQLESALREGDLRKVGECLSRSWYLNKQIEPTASNSDIERLFTAIQPWVFGAKLAGAGGGGFLFALARDAQAVPRIVQALIDAGAPASGYHPARVAQQGLVVETNRA